MHPLSLFLGLIQQSGLENSPWSNLIFTKAMSVSMLVATVRICAPISINPWLCSSTLSLIIVMFSWKTWFDILWFTWLKSQFSLLHWSFSNSGRIGQTKAQTNPLVVRSIKLWSALMRSPPCSTALPAESRTIPPWPRLTPNLASASPPPLTREAEACRRFPVCSAQNIIIL